jgi:hypothetical protein
VGANSEIVAGSHNVDLLEPERRHRDFLVFKILTLKKLTTTEINIQSGITALSVIGKVPIAVFFLFHYGFFHFAYAVFLRSFSKGVELRPIFSMAGVFLVYECFSFFYNRKWEGKQKQDTGKLLGFPYVRIIPMHLTIIFGGILSAGTFKGRIPLAIFMLLKTVVDAAMHNIERKGPGFTLKRNI